MQAARPLESPRLARTTTPSTAATVNGSATPEPTQARGLVGRLFRRRQYRVRGPFLSRYRCSLRDPEDPNRLYPVDLVDCSLGGAAIVVPPGDAPEPAFNTHCQLRVDDGVTGEGHEVLGYVRRAERREDAWTIGVSFVDFERLVPDLDGEWWRIFNRRRVLRAVLAPEEGARVRLLGPGLSSDAVLVDLSIEGVGLELPAELADRLEETFSCFVQVGGVPELGVSGALAASMRHVSALDERTVRFGLSWKPDRSRDWESSRAAIVRFVDARERRARVLG